MAIETKNSLSESLQLIKEFPCAYKMAITPLDELNIDRGYQRDEKEHAMMLSMHFDPEAFLALIVGRRSNGSLWVIDGQQRALAARYAGYVAVPTLIIPSKGRRHEASLFHLINGVRKPVTPLETFHAAMVAGKKYAREISKVVKRNGFEIPRISKNISWGVISCVTKLVKIHAEHGVKGLNTVFHLIKAVWPEEDTAVSTEIVAGLGGLLSRLKNLDREIDIKHWEKAMKGKSAVMVSRKAAEMQSRQIRRGVSGYQRYQAVEDHLFKLYNVGLRATKAK